MNDSSKADAASPDASDEAALPTAPDGFGVSLRAFDTEENARTFGHLVGAYVRELSRHFDLASLDGITVAYDYAQALLDLDRGYATSFKLTPSDGIVLGVAMTPAVMRNGNLKSHMLFNAGILRPLEDDKSDLHGLALHTLAHECAHVEVTARFNAAFPNVLLQSKTPNLHAHCRSDIILACWDEYAVTKMCAGFGQRPTDGYEETFIRALAETRPRVNTFIKAYRLHGNLEQIIGEVYGALGNLMKFASYHLGNIEGLGLTLDDLPKTRTALDGHWFASYFQKLSETCATIDASYGKWTDRSTFEALGDLADEVAEDCGLYVSDHTDDGRFSVDIPFTPDTMPDAPD